MAEASFTFDDPLADLAIVGTQKSWADDATCAQADPEAFFPERGGSVREAKKVCARCEVRAQCLQFALDNDERFGVWGGLSERERRRLRHTTYPAAAETAQAA